MTPSTPLGLLRRRLGLFSGEEQASEQAEGNGGMPHPAEGAAERSLVLERGAWTLVWLGVLVGGAVLWSSWGLWPVLDLLAPALAGAGIVGLIATWCVRSPRSLLYQGLAMTSAVVAILAQQGAYLHTRIYYATDSAGLDHVAARLLSDGHNPYTNSLASVGYLLKTPDSFWTYMVTGSHVTGVSYPAGSFLFYAPAFALGFRHLVVDWMDLYAWLASAVILFLLLPRALRWIAALVTLTGIFTAIFSGGGTDAAFLPFAMLAIWRWDRYGRGREAGVARWLGPFALGLACAIKQDPWFLVPFLLIGIWIETRRAGRAPLPVVVRYLGITLATFVVVNLPFVIWSPAAWWHGTLLPFTAAFVADGQGIVSLALHGLTGGADLSQLTAASVLALLSVLALFATWYRALKRVWLLLIPVPYFFSPRSFTGYLVDLFPVAVMGLLTVDAAPAPLEPARRWGRYRPGTIAAGLLALGTVTLTAVSFTGPPLTVTYRSATVGGDEQAFLSVVVSVTNHTASTQRPHFLVNIGQGHPAGFWAPSRGRPVVLAPHATATVTLYPPDPTFFPPWGTDFVVDAYTSSPRALSTTPDIWHNFLPILPEPVQHATGTKGR